MIGPMHRCLATTRRFLQANAARAVWGGLLALHVPILLAVIASLASEGANLGRLWSVASLAVALAFFVLKFADAPFLRLRTRQQALVAYCLIVAIAHQGSIVRRCDDPTIPIAATVSLTTMAVGGIAIARRGVVTDLWNRLRAQFARPSIRLRAIGQAPSRAAGSVDHVALAIRAARAPPR
jgi:hypothetical protein